MHRIFCLIGKSASGKDKLYQRLLEDPELDLGKVVLYTTRPIRTGEEEGREYHFVPEETYAAFRKEGRIIEERAYHTECGLWRYFTVNDGQIRLTERDSLVIATVESYSAFCRYFGREQVVSLYVEVEDGERLARALRRERKQEHPKYAELCRRFLADEEDFSSEKLEAAGITEKDRYANPDGGFEDCLAALKAAIRQAE